MIPAAMLALALAAGDDPACPPAHAAMGHCTPSAGAPPRAEPPSEATTGPAFAADTVWGAQAMAPSRQAVFDMHGDVRGHRVLIDRLEARAQDGKDGYAWDGQAWFGGDYDRLVLKTTAEGRRDRTPETAEVQALWSHALDPWFELQAGVRHDFHRGQDRTHLALGVQGLAPYWFEVDAAAFVSDRGAVSARVEAEYDMRLTNRLILQPRLEANLAAQTTRSTGAGAGLSTLETGLRLRYALKPEFAPYVGVDYHRGFGDTADLARAAGEKAGGWTLVAGVRAWF